MTFSVHGIGNPGAGLNRNRLWINVFSRLDGPGQRSTRTSSPRISSTSM